VNGRRDHPRLGISLRATLALPDGTTAEGLTQNLSCDGFQLAAGRAVVDALFPQGRQPGPRERREVQVALHDVSTLGAEVRCAGVFARRMSQSAWHVGFQFVDLQPGTSLWIEARIASALRRAGTP